MGKTMKTLKEWENTPDGVYEFGDGSLFFTHEDGCYTVFATKETVGGVAVPKPSGKYVAEAYNENGEPKEEEETWYAWDVPIFRLTRAVLEAGEAPPDPESAPVEFLSWCVEHGALKTQTTQTEEE